MKKIADPWALLAAIETAGTLAKAAKALELTLSTASKAIADLEKQFDVTLLDRRKKPAVLTDEAYKLLPAVKAKLASEKTLYRQIEDIKRKDLSESSGTTLRLSLPINMGRITIFEALRRYEAFHPTIRLEIQTDCRVEDVLEGNTDIAWFGFKPQEHPNLMTYRIGLNRTFMMATPKYLHEHKPIKAIDDLKDHMILLRDSKNPSSARRLETPQGLLELSESQPCLFGDALSCKTRVLASEGIAFDLTPGFMLQELVNCQVVPVLPLWHREPWDIHLAYLKRVGERAEVQALSEIIWRHFNAVTMEHWSFWYRHFGIRKAQ